MPNDTRTPFREKVRALDEKTPINLKIGVAIGLMASTVMATMTATHWGDTQLNTIAEDHAAIGRLEVKVDRLLQVCDPTWTATASLPANLPAVVKGARGKVAPFH